MECSPVKLTFCKFIAVSNSPWLTFQYAADSTKHAAVTSPNIEAKTTLILRVKKKKVKSAQPYRHMIQSVIHTFHVSRYKDNSSSSSSHGTTCVKPNHIPRR